MLRRTIQGILLLAVVVGCWRWDSLHPDRPAWAMAALGVVLTIGALDELMTIARLKPADRALGHALGGMWLAILLLAGLMPLRVNQFCGDLLTAGSLVANLYLAFQLRHGPGEQPARLARSLWFAVPYVGGVACFVALLVSGVLHYVVGITLLVKASDSGAYFAGRLFGRTKLAPTISPNKTMEGAVGGMLTPALLAPLLLASSEIPLHGGTVGLALVGLLVGVLAMVGDLGESLLKRSLGVKDSGRLFGPSGGFLDLADSLLLVGPFALAYTAVLV